MLKVEYVRNLPHLQYVGAIFFVTFRLKGSLPASVIQGLITERDNAIARLNERNSSTIIDEIDKEKKRYFARIERTLDACQYGPDWLRLTDIRMVVANRIKQAAPKGYDLLAYCIMPNHVHLVVDTANQLDALSTQQEVTDDTYQQLYKTLGLIKGGSAFEANRLLNRTGAFWQPESYDHYVRDGNELARIIDYVVQNPVRAGLVTHWEAWPGTFLDERF